MARVRFLSKIWVLLICFSCQDDFILDRIDIEVITMLGDEEQYTFEAGSDVTLALRLTNKSRRDFEWDAGYGCLFTTQKDFMLVRKVTTSQSSTRIGTPNPFPINCLAINSIPQKIGPGEKKIIIAYPWSIDPDHTPLAPGQYFTEFEIMLELDGGRKIWNLRTEFSVE
jgi:hypothetical protein